MQNLKRVFLSKNKRTLFLNLSTDKRVQMSETDIKALFSFSFQQIYTEDMSSLSDAAKSRLLFTSARRSMITERMEAIPSSPNTFAEAILGFEAGMYPPLYQDLYLGHAKHNFEGKEVMTLSKHLFICF